MNDEPYNLGTNLGIGYCDDNSEEDSSDCTPFGITIQQQDEEQQQQEEEVSSQKTVLY